MAHDDGDESYDNTHRALLQAFLAHGTLTLDDAKPILAAIHNAQQPERPTLVDDIAEADFSTYVSEINARLSPFDYSIQSALDQNTRTRVYALVNTTSDAPTQMATTHTPDEIAFTTRVLDAIFDTYNTPRAEVLAITSLQALRLARPPAGAQSQAGAAATAGLTQGQAEAMLQSLVAEGWFRVSRRGFYTLAPRALLELRGWLVETYNMGGGSDAGSADEDGARADRVKFCQACKEIVTLGQRCPQLVCRARLHAFCTPGMFRAQGGAEKCPLCKTAWRGALPVGEKAARTRSARPSTADGMGSRGRGGARRQSSRMGVDDAGEDDVDDDDDEDGENDDAVAGSQVP